MTVADGGVQPRPSGRISTGTQLAVGLLGAALYAFANWTTFAIAIPGTDDVSLRPQYALVVFIGFAFGPVAGFLAGLIGNVLGDALTGWGAFTSWPWSVANGLAGLLSGAFALRLAQREMSPGSRAILAGVAGVAATALGFLVIFVELWTQQLSFEEILRTEYLPTVLVNSVVAAIITPIVVWFWDPLHDFFGQPQS